jgi:4-hydroxyphenylacetate 3-monooxygenase
VHEVEDVYVHKVGETDEGIIVSGAKMLATGSALTHATFVAQNAQAVMEKGKSEDYALVFIAPMDTPGKKLLCRTSYERASTSPWNYPLSSRFDENDAVVIFDNALIPWDNVLVDGDIERAQSFFQASGFVNRYTLQSTTRLGVKLDFMCGLLAKGLEANGTGGFRGPQAMLGEVVAWRTMIWAIVTALINDTQPGPGGTIMPAQENAAIARIFGTMAWPRIKQTFLQILGGSPLVVFARAQRPDERGDRPARGALLPRVDRRGPRPREAVQAHLGCDRQRVRRPARALRDELLRQLAGFTAAPWADA